MDWAAAAALILTLDLLCFMCDLTKCPAAIADKIDNSAARTDAHTIRANLQELRPGSSLHDPLTPNSC